MNVVEAEKYLKKCVENATEKKE